MTDEEVETAALSDPDAQPLAEEELAQGFRPGRLIAARRRLGLSQAAFAERFHINLRTLQDWEQPRRVPDQVTHAYLRVIAHNADVVVAALGTDPRQQRKIGVARPLASCAVRLNYIAVIGPLIRELI